MRRLLSLAFVAAAIAACDRAASDSDAARAVTITPPQPGDVVDSALPIPVLLERFRATVPDTPTVLVGGEASPEALSRALLTALQTQDTATVRRLVISRAEFAWLYYPHTRFTAPPYEMGPDLLWLQMGAASEKGATRLLRRYGGTALGYQALLCPDSVSVEGPNRIRVGCRVRFSIPDSGSRELRLFGSLLERDGRHKFVSYANEL